MTSTFAPGREAASFAAPDGCALAVTRVALTDFRSYAGGELCLDASPVVLWGANGIGKTNLLEALSLLSPGRGLRGAKLASVRRNDAAPEANWALSATVAREFSGEWRIGTGYIPSSPGAQPRRVFHLNDVPADPAEIAELLPLLWLTPAMDRLFVEGAQLRRRFLDRLVFALVPSHARRSSRYERATADRLRLLREGTRRGAWIESLEKTMSEEAAALRDPRAFKQLEEKLYAEKKWSELVSAYASRALALEDMDQRERLLRRRGSRRASPRS